MYVIFHIQTVIRLRVGGVLAIAQEMNVVILYYIQQYKLI